MTNQHANWKRLAELLGWTEIDWDGRFNSLGTAPNGKPGFVPDWFNDLNAAHELGGLIANMGLREEYLAELGATGVEAGIDYDWWFLQATAAQRAEAALRVLEAAEKED